MLKRRVSDVPRLNEMGEKAGKVDYTLAKRAENPPGHRSPKRPPMRLRLREHRAVDVLEVRQPDPRTVLGHEPVHINSAVCAVAAVNAETERRTGGRSHELVDLPLVLNDGIGVRMDHGYQSG